jgi:hypothetical protein
MSMAEWPKFIAAVAERLEAGRGSYGGRSFSRSVEELIGEIEEELEDVAGWAFILWCRIARLREILPKDGLPDGAEEQHSGNTAAVERR